MESGVRTFHPDDLPDFDLIDFADLICSIGRYDTLHLGDRFPPTLSAVSIARIAQGVVEQKSGHLGKGRPTIFRKRARILVEETFIGSSYLSGNMDMLRALWNDDRVDEETYKTLAENTKLLDWRHIVKTAASAGLIIQDIATIVERKGLGRGKKFGDLSIVDNEVIQLSSMLQSAISEAKLAAFSAKKDPDAITLEDVRGKFRQVIANRFRTGELRIVGDNEKDVTDAYQKRLVRYHEHMLCTVKSGPITIDWKFRQLMAAEGPVVLA